MTMRYQPMQPVEVDGSGTHGFRENKVVTYLLDKGGKNLNDLALVDFPKEDRDQFTQLIGYSVSGAPISPDLRNAALDQVKPDGGDTDRARIAYLEGELARIREAFRQPVADLFCIHSDDLQQ